MQHLTSYVWSAAHFPRERAHNFWNKFNARMEEYFDDCERNDIELEGIEVLDKALEYAAFEFLSDKPPKPQKAMGFG